NGSYKSYYINGNLSEIGQSLNNFYTGPWKSYYKEGTIQAEYTYENGSLNGEYKSYDTDGKPHYEYLYRKGEVMTFKYYNKEGQILKEEKKKGGEFNFTGYSPQGNITSEGLYDVKGGKKGLWKFFSNNGVLTSKGNYINNNVEGLYTNYFKNGNILSLAEYKN